MKSNNSRLPLLAVLLASGAAATAFAVSSPSPTSSPRLAANPSPTQSPRLTTSPTPMSSPSPDESPSPTVSPGPESMSAVTLHTSRSTRFGEYLVDAQGRSLYLFMADSPGVSNCSAECARVWPPLLVPSGQSVSGAEGVQETLISTIQRPDGTMQVTYNGWPLYYYLGDQNPGDTQGHGINQSGATWHLMKPDGTILGSQEGSGNGSPSGTILSSDEGNDNGSDD